MNIQALKDLSGQLNVQVECELCPPNMIGDITINCFKFARNLGLNPDAAAEKVMEFLRGHDDVESVEKIKAFVNLTLKPSAIMRDAVTKYDHILAESILPSDKQQKIVIEYSAPNTNKPQHLGHVRNNTLGMSLASLLSRIGHDVNPVNLVNDRGIHICKSMMAYKRFGEGKTPISEKMKGDHFVGHYYVLFNKALTEQLAQLKIDKPELADRDNESLFLETEIGCATQKMLQDWEAGNEEVIALWKLMNSWVLAGFDETYKRMGIEYKKTYFESDTYILGKDIVEEGLQRNIFKKRDDGAVYAPLGKTLGDKVVLRSDGTSVYITQDIGTTLLKQKQWNAERQIWVVGDEQIHHFNQLFAIIKLLGYSWADGLYHLAYGMVNLPTGKMKSREGTVVDADDLFDEMHALAKEKIVETSQGSLPEDLESRAEKIGMGALKFMLLKFNAKTTMQFDPQASVRFEGDTGPYVQYACARIHAIERKANEKGIFVSEKADLSLLTAPEEKALATKLFFYPNVLFLAGEKMDCSPLTLYALELAKLFSRFYAACSVLNADPHLAEARLTLCARVRQTLKDVLKTLTIDVPEAM